MNKQKDSNRYNNPSWSLRGEKNISSLSPSSLRSCKSVRKIAIPQNLVSLDISFAVIRFFEKPLTIFFHVLMDCPLGKTWGTSKLYCTYAAP